MADAHEPEHYSVPDQIGDIWMFPRPIVWAAGLIIVAMAGFGLYQGLHTAVTAGAGSSNADEQSNTGAVSAQAAQALSSSAPWSALNGPAMSSATSSARTATVSAAPSSQAADTDNDNDQAESAAAPPPVVNAAPPPVAVSAAPSLPVSAAPPRARSAAPPRSATPARRATPAETDDNAEPQ